MARERRKFEVDDVGDRLAKHTSGARASISLPQNLPMWKPKKTGSLTIEIVPYLVTDAIKKFPEKLRFTRPGKWYPERTFYVHGGVGVNKESYTCPAATFGKACPICEHRATLYKSPDKESITAANKMKPKDRQMFLILDHEDMSKGIQLWEIANWNFGKHLDKYIEGADPEDKPAYKKFFDPYEGFTIKLTASEEIIDTGKNTIYTVHQFKPRKEELDIDLFDHGFDLDAMVRLLTYDELEKAYNGTAEDDDDNQDAPVRPSATPTRPERNGEKQKDDDDEPAPKRRSKEEAPCKFASRDKVGVSFMEEDVEGIIESIDVAKGWAMVKIPDRNKPVQFDFEEMTLIEEDDTFDKKPEKSAKKPKQEEPEEEVQEKPKAKSSAKSKESDWDDDDSDDGRTFKPKKSEDDDVPEKPKAKSRK